MNPMVIIGAGECGTRAAFALREAGHAGPITLIGEEPGLPYERPPLSKPDAAGAVRKPICSADQLAAASITLIEGAPVTALDTAARQLTLAGGRTLAWDRLLLATGAQPRRLTCPGAARALPFRTHADAQAVIAAAQPGARVAIIGAGLIGMELAAVLNARGAQVTVIEAGPRAMGRAVPAALAERLAAHHAAAGVVFHFGAAVAGIEDGAVVLADGRRCPADLVVAAIGVVPDTALAKAAGLAVGNGILTDARLETSVPGVFAAGDCAAVTLTGGPVRSEAWRSARDQAEHAARAMLGAAAAYRPRPWFWSDQLGWGLQVAGDPALGSARVTRSAADGSVIEFALDPTGRLVAAAGLGPGNAVARDIRLAEMLIDAAAAPDPAALADAAVPLKSLLRARAA